MLATSVVAISADESSLKTIAVPATAMNIASTATRSFPVFVLFTFAFIGAYDENFLNSVNSF